ncbi:MAG: LutB/LldF family L-lactate oxidation iron-sulfur protein [Bacillota bacterium]
MAYQKPTRHLRERAVEKLGQEEERNNIRRAVDRLAANKEKAASELGNWDDWRERGKEIRKHVVNNLDYYLKQLTENLIKNGAKVHFANEAKDASRITADICQRHQAKMVVKSKSMVSEEIHLNDKLIEMGIEVVETDLAEYILQLADEAPSHIIVPSMHKNRYQIAQLFSKEAGETLSSDTPTLTAFSRKVLRKKFLTADVGVTGCNFAIAETGSLALVTNEGNARMCNTYPKVHIAIMGMERIVPAFEDFEALLTLLPRSATGQKITSYVSVINGPRKGDDLDGPDELHVIILDNGRSRMLADSEFRQALHCIRCGACFNICPVYRQIGGHSYGSVYGGPIGSVITPLLEDDLDFWGELPYASTLCAACSSVCAVKIPLHDLLLKLRHRKVAAGHTPAMERVTFRLWKNLFQKPGRYRLAMHSAAIFQKPLVRSGYIKIGPPPLSAWTNSRYFPAAAKKSFRQLWQEQSENKR